MTRPPQRRERFAHQCHLAGIDPKELIVDVRTRWNSTHDMIERALELREPLDNMAAHDTNLVMYQLTPEEWQLLKDVRKFLKAFKTASNHLCAARHPTITIGVPVYNFLIDRLEGYRDAPSSSDAVKAATNAAINKLKAYYSKTGAEVYPVGTILDPRFKINYYHPRPWLGTGVDPGGEDDIRQRLRTLLRLSGIRRGWKSASRVGQRRR